MKELTLEASIEGLFMAAFENHSSTLNGRIKWLVLVAATFGVIGLIGLGLYGLGEDKMGGGESSDLGLFLGRFHPLILHLPIGALSVVLIQEMGRFLSRGKWSPDSFLALSVAAISSVLSAITGFLLGQDTYDQDLLTEHFLWGIGFGVALCLVWLVAAFRRFQIQLKYRVAYVSLLGVSGLAMVGAGHHGASLTHGSDYLTFYAPSFIRSALGLPERASARNRSETELDKAPGSQNFFAAHIEPIFESKCWSCHGESKNKGKLRMDTLAAIMEGGSEGPAVVPGDPAKSTIFERIQLPLDDEYHMPPSGKAQLTERQTELIRIWIENGARDDQPVSEIKAPAGFFDEEGSGDHRGVTHSSKPSEMTASELEAAIAEIDAVNKRFPGSLNLVSRSSKELSFTAVAFAADFDDESLAILAPYAERIVEADFTGTAITESAISSIQAMTALRRLRLNGTQLTSTDIKGLSDLPALESLSLHNCPIDSSIEEILQNFPALEKVYLPSRAIDEAARVRLEARKNFECVSGL